MAFHKIVLLPGDGIGPEITCVTKKILEFIGKKHNIEFSFIEKEFGGKAIDLLKEPLPEGTLSACKNSDAVLLAAIGDPKYDSFPREIRPETGLLQLRESLDLFANIRPVKIREALIDSSSLKKEIVKNVDLIVVRELTGGIYFGKPKGRVKTENGYLCLASDATHFYENFLMGKPFPIVVDLEDMLNGFKLIKSLATSNDMVIPGHDPLVKNFFPKEGTSGFVWRLDKGPTSPVKI